MHVGTAMAPDTGRRNPQNFNYRRGCVSTPSLYKAAQGGNPREPARAGEGAQRVPMPAQEAISSFIAATFRSAWALELLCFLRKNRHRSLSHAEMVGELRASDLVVRHSLDSLVAAGLALVEPDGSARFGPASEALDKMAGDVEELYANSPDAVRRIIVSAANPSLAAFADAFRLRKD